MKYIFTTLILFLAQIAISQKQIADTNRNDTLRNESFLSRFLYQNLNKHTHIIDVEFVEFELSQGALGYNYFYSLNKRIKVGGRVGLWYFSPRPDVPPAKARTAITHSVFGLANVSIWKSLQGELGIGYANSFSWASKTNTQASGTQFDNGSLNLRAGVNLTIFNHLFLRGGIMFNYNSVPKDWYNMATWSIGYKF